MNKLIHRTLTIMLIETWTFVWTVGDNPLGHPPTSGQDNQNRKEGPTDAFQTTVSHAEPGKSSVGAPMASPLTTVAAVAEQPDGTPASSITTRQRKQTRSRCTGSNPQRP